jgi:hemolysin activation/secretion protein
VLVLLPQLALGQVDTTEPLPLPPSEEASPGLLPSQYDTSPFATPYEPPVLLPSGESEVETIFDLPPVDHFLPPRAIPIPTARYREISFEGNTAFDDAELHALIERFLDRELVQEDLDRLRFEITLHYLSNGYINSVATIPDQDSTEGTLAIRIIEGQLTDVIPRGNKALTDRYLTRRILAGGRSPLHFPTLQRQLQVLQANPNIARINAELKPGLLAGEALMVLDLEELPRWSYGMDFHNQRSPSVGGKQAELWFENRNLSGTSDNLRARLGLFSGDPDDLELAGLDNLSGLYQRPLLADDTTLVLGGSMEDYSVLEEPFRGLAIEGESWSANCGLRRPLYRSLNDEVWATFLLEKSHDETSLLGRPFSISPGSVNGELDLTLLRFGLEWTRRTRESVLAMRTMLSAGIDALGATRPIGEPNGEFFTWALDTQYSRRICDRGDVLVLHGGFQLATDPLPAPAQYRVGGRYTVRGYRENFLVRDNGVQGGIDYQLPLHGGKDDDDWSLWLVPFLDCGVGWNEGSSSSTTLASIGVGVRSTYGEWFRGELYYGIPLLNRPNRSDDIQDDGVHFRLSFARF